MVKVDNREKEIDWQNLDVVLLDMDGTLIDLHFDNRLWNTHLTTVYAQTHQISEQKAAELLFAHMRANVGTIEFYCLDYWAKFTELDIMQLHRDLVELLRFRDGTETFLRWLQSQPSRTLMATNAHRSSLQIKAEHIDMLGYFDKVVSSHDYQQVKESQTFWQTLVKEENFDPARALFIDDNESVLDAAKQFGIGHVLCVASPDSKRPARSDSAYRMINGLDELIPESVGNPSPRSK